MNDYRAVWYTALLLGVVIGGGLAMLLIPALFPIPC